MDLSGYVTWVFLVFCYVRSHDNIGASARTLSDLEHLEIQSQLKRLNKPAVKIIKTIYGERYACVDFYKQPAFDHPSLKNHSYNYTELISQTLETHGNSPYGHIWENGVGCPFGTVPIKRVTKDELIRLNSIGHEYVPQEDVRRYFVAGTKTNANDSKYYGATMDASIEGPDIPFVSDKYSSSRIQITLGDSTFIQAGWHVNPLVSVDDPPRPRTFIFTKNGGKSSYNYLHRSGFVLLSFAHMPGTLLTATSQSGVATYTAKFNLSMKEGRWKLFFNDFEVGFWAPEVLKADWATAVEWGGAASSPGSAPSPPMGNGQFPEGNTITDAYAKNIGTMDKNLYWDTKVEQTRTFTSNSKGYKAIEEIEGPNGHIVYFGGPGGV